MRWMLFATTLFGTASVAVAENIELTAYEFALDANAYVGEVVTLTGCKFAFASLEYAQCQVYSKTGMVGTIAVDVASMSKDDKRYLTTECAEILSGDACIVDIVAVVETRYGNIRLFDGRLVHPTFPEGGFAEGFDGRAYLPGGSRYNP